MVDDQGLIHSIERIDKLVESIESHAGSGVQSEIRELVQCLLDYHGAAIGRIVQLLGQPASAAGPIVDRLAEDPLVASLLLLHDCHPRDFAERIEQALAQVRPLLASHGGDVELAGIADGVVRLRLLGNCHGCPSSTATMKTHVEQAVYAVAPETMAIDLEESPGDDTRPAGFVPLEQLASRSVG